MSNNNNSDSNVPIPTEILLQIFSYLNKDYISLYKCLLVNKYWYIHVLEILYSNPFHLLQTNINNYKNYFIKNNSYTIENRIVKLIDLYIKCLKQSKDFKEIENRLNDKGIIYVYDENSLISFDYTLYLKYLRYDDLYNFIAIYLNSLSNILLTGGDIVGNKSLFTYSPYSVITRRTITIELFKKFLDQRKNLIELSVNTSFILDMNYFNGIDQDLSDIFKYQSYALNNIHTLNCGGIKFDEILKLLQNNLNLTSIKNFIIDFNLPYHNNNYNNNFNLTSKYYISSDKITEFLSVQKNLRKLCIIGRYHDLYGVFFKLSQQNILRKLTCLEFYGIIFNNHNNNLNDTLYQDNNIKERSLLMNGIIQCYNLQELVFEDCVNLTSEVLYRLRNSQFTSLKRFTFRNCSGKNINSLSSNDSLATLIRNTRRVLEEIRFGRKLRWCIRKVYDVGNITLEEMMTCEKLKVVECYILADVIDEFFELLKVLNTLEKVIVSVDCELSDNELFWKRFGKALSENRHSLNELSICIGGYMGGNNFENELWIEMFEWFFNSCNIPIDILKFPMCYSINENYLKVIERYAKRVGVVQKVMLSEGVIKRQNVNELRIENVKCVHVCCDDMEFGDDDLMRRCRFRSNITTVQS